MPYCSHCGKELSDAATSCPNCDAPLSTPADQLALEATPPRTSGFAAASLVLGMLGWVSAGLLAVPGMILGIVAYVQIQRRPQEIRGVGLATAGMVVSGVALVIGPMMAAILYPVYARAREAARRSSCQSNLHQLATAVIAYANDHDDRLPPVYDSATGLSWPHVIQPYPEGRDARVMCPSSGRGQAANELTLTESSELDYGMNCEPYRRRFVDNAGTNDCAATVLGSLAPETSRQSAISYRIVDVTYPDMHVLLADYGDAPHWTSRDGQPDSRSGGVAYRICLPDRAKLAAYACTCARQCDTWGDDGTTETSDGLRSTCGGIARFRHYGYPNVAFADGHVRSVGIGELWGDPGLWCIDYDNP